MKRLISIGVVLLVILGIVGLAYMRAAEFRTPDSSRLDDAASFFMLLFLLVFIGIALDYFGDSWLQVTQAKHRLKTIEPEYDTANADVESARQEIAAREEAPGLWLRRAHELAAAYDGEYKAEISRISTRSTTAHAPFLGEDGRKPHEH